MSLLDRITGQRKASAAEKQVQEYFKLLNAYTPTFTSLEGGVYEMELTRAAIHAFATHCSKLTPVVSGPNNQAFERRLQLRPNPNMSLSQYLYKLATLLMVDNTAFIVPIYEKDQQTIAGYYPFSASSAQLIDYNGEQYFRFRGSAGQTAIKKDRVGILNQFLYRSDFFGETNAPLKPTMDLIDTTNQGIKYGVKNAAYIRFIAKLAMSLSPDDIERERVRLTEENLKTENNSGILLFDQRYEDIKQVQSAAYSVDPKQMEQIRQNVFYYFGINDHILSNDYNSEQWAAYYEGKIEPFAIQLSMAHTAMTFSDKERAYGNSIIFTANKLQYLSPKEKLETVTQLVDRGIITLNEGREIYNMPGFGPDGDKRYIRKEYAEIGDLGADQQEVEEESE